MSGKMVLGEDEKLIRVKIEVHKALTDLRAFPNRANYSDVIAWLNEERKIWREFYIREYMRHGFSRKDAEENCNHCRKMLDESDEGWAVFENGSEVFND